MELNSPKRFCIELGYLLCGGKWGNCEVDVATLRIFAQAQGNGAALPRFQVSFVETVLVRACQKHGKNNFPILWLDVYKLFVELLKLI